MVTARQLVDPPTFTPLPFGLLSVAQSPPAPPGTHHLGGVSWRSRCPASGMGTVTWDECVVVTGTGTPPPPPTKADNVDVTHRGATPFTPYAEFDCSPVGNEDALRDAQQALAQSEPWLVERTFWTGAAQGTVVAYPHLTSTVTVLDSQGFLLQSPVVTGGGAFKPPRALGVLEGLLADCYDGVGVVHIPQRALPAFDAWGLVRASGALLKTLNGNVVAAGAGYPGTGPDGGAPAAGQVWVYATGAVFAYRGPVRTNTVRDSLDRAENTIKMIAERTYVLGWDCCHVGVLVDLT